MTRKILIPASFLILSVLLCACGYRFSGEGEGPKPGLKLIAIPVFENRTTEPDLGAILAGALRREFLQRGPMRVVPVEEAEAVFKGTITSIFVTPVAHHPTETIAANRITVENRVHLTIDIRCEEKATGKILWKDPKFTYYTVYRLSKDPLNPNPLAGFESRSAAVEVVAREMATKIHDLFLSNF